MSEQALPCIRCGIALTNVLAKWTENQPNDGVICTTTGNYGSAVWDAEDGSKLYFNLCDECLVKAGEEGRVLVGKPRRPVVTIRGVQIGWERLDRPLVEWRRGMDGSLHDNDVCEVPTVEEFDSYTAMVDGFGWPKLEWTRGHEHARESVQRDWIEQVELDTCTCERTTDRKTGQWIHEDHCERRTDGTLA